MNLPPIQHLIAIGVILFILRMIMGALGSVSPIFHSIPAQIIVYFLAAVAFVVWIYKDDRRKHVNPHEIEIQALSQIGQKKPEVWTMPEDHHKKPNDQS